MHRRQRNHLSRFLLLVRQTSFNCLSDLALLEGDTRKYPGRNDRGKKTPRVNATKRQVDFLHRILKQPSLRYPSHSRVFELVIFYFNLLDPSGDSRALTVDQMRKKFENQRRACAKRYPELFTERPSAGRRTGSAFVESSEPLRSADECHMHGISDVYAAFERDSVACMASSAAAAGTAMDQEAPDLAADDDAVGAALSASLSPHQGDPSGVAAQEEVMFGDQASASSEPSIVPEPLSAPEFEMRAFDIDFDRVQRDPVEALEGTFLPEGQSITAEEIQEVSEFLDSLPSVMSW